MEVVYTTDKYKRMYEEACKNDPRMIGANWHRRLDHEITIWDDDGDFDVCYDGYHDKFSDAKLEPKELNRELEKKIFGENLSRIMREKDVSRWALSAVTGISPRTLTKYMEGRLVPGYISILTIADTLQCAVADLTCEH